MSETGGNIATHVTTAKTGNQKKKVKTKWIDPNDPNAASFFDENGRLDAVIGP